MSDEPAAARESLQEPGPVPPVPRSEVIIASATSAERELYGALMRGLPDDVQGNLEDLMVDNIARLREDGDGYAP